MLGFIIAECPECGQRYYAYDEETVRQKYSQHKCSLAPKFWTDKELWEYVDQYLAKFPQHGKGEASAAGEGSGTAEIPKPQAPIKTPSVPPKMRPMATITRRFVGLPESGE